MQAKTIKVQCECGGKETIGSLIGKITAGAQELNRLLNSQPSDFLSRSFYHTQLCTSCKGKGFINVANGPDDFDKAACEACHGTGRLVANN